jgi:hypothetical protein
MNCRRSRIKFRFDQLEISGQCKRFQPRLAPIFEVLGRKQGQGGGDDKETGTRRSNPIFNITSYSVRYSLPNPLIVAQAMFLLRVRNDDRG